MTVAVLFSTLSAAAAGAKPAYPAAPADGTHDTYFGTTVADPYRPLESVDAPRTVAWVQEQGALTRSYLDAIPERPAIREKYKTLLDFEKLSAPFREGSHWFSYRNSGLQNQAVLYIGNSAQAQTRPFLDPNSYAADGTVAVSGESFPKTGRFMAFSTQGSGSDWQTWHVRDVASGKDLPDVLEWSKFSGAAWDGDSGFYYARFDKPTDPNATLAALGVHKVYYHTLGQPQSEDRLVFADPAQPDVFAGVGTTDDERYVFLYRSKGHGNSLAWKNVREPDSAFRTIFALDPNVSYDVLGNDGSKIYLETNNGAKRGRVVWIELNDPAHQVHELVPESSDTLSTVSLIGDSFYVGYLHDAHSLVKIVDITGKNRGSIDLPGIGSGGVPSGKREDRYAFYGFTSYTFPTTIYRYDTQTKKSREIIRPKIAFDSAGYVTEQLFATSKDGTKVPVFFIHRKGMPMDGSTPTILYGYGGFNISETPAFRSSIAMWLQMGGAYADVVLRGGGEYGDAWHDAGRLHEKQRVFDDFLAAAQLLLDTKATSTPKLAINGGSNGGLLVGAALTQRPDLFGAAIPEVGVLDMLRFQKFTVGKAWIPEYGSSDASAEQFNWLYAYSPVHNVKPGTHYPPTLIMTADHDDRVFPAHSFKFAAALQAAQAGDAPILLRVQTKAGHGAGRPTDKIIDDVADRYAFLVKSLDFKPWLKRGGVPPLSP